MFFIAAPFSVSLYPFREHRQSCIKEQPFEIEKWVVSHRWILIKVRSKKNVTKKSLTQLDLQRVPNCMFDIFLYHFMLHYTKMK